MNGLLIFFIVATLIIVAAVFIIIMSLVVIKPPPKKQDSTNSTTVSPVIYEKWSEHIRNNKPIDGFPPCFENFPPCKSIFGILASYNLTQKYFNLLDCLSVLCCQQMNNHPSGCNKLWLKDRQVMFIGLGADPDNESAISKVKAYTKSDDTNSPIFKLLVSGIYLIDQDLAYMHMDTTISQTDKNRIQGFINDFYARYLITMMKQCKD